MAEEPGFPKEKNEDMDMGLWNYALNECGCAICLYDENNDADARSR